MRVYRAYYKNSKAERRKVKKWWIETAHRLNGIRTVVRFAGDTDKGLTTRLGNKIDDLIRHAEQGVICPTEIVKKIQDYAPKRTQERLRELGLLPKEKVVVKKTLAEFLPEFQEYVLLESKRSKMKKATSDDRQAREVTIRVRKLLDACGFVYWADVTAKVVNAYFKNSKKSQQTNHHYCQAFIRFAKWMAKEGHADNVLEITRIPADKNFGRMFELDEFADLLEATKDAPVRYGLTGHQRYLLYLVAVETGLRRGELRSLTPVSFDQKDNSLFVQGKDCKNGDDAIQFVTPKTGTLLKEYCRDKLPTTPLFVIPYNSADMIRKDCKAAGIETENHRGRITFHSLRHTCGSYAIATGASNKETMDIMRHKDVNLTLNRYVKLLAGKKRKAVNRMAEYTHPQTGKEGVA